MTQDDPSIREFTPRTTSPRSSPPTPPSPPATPSHSGEPAQPASNAPPRPAELPPEELALLARLRANDPLAYEQLVREHGGHMLAVARRYLSKEEDAADAVQDAFLSAFKALPKFEGHARLSTWLHRITVNAALMKRRAARSRPAEAFGGGVVPGPGYDAGGSGGDPIEEMLPRFNRFGTYEKYPKPWNLAAMNGIEREESLRALRTALDKLPEAYRLIVSLRDIEGLDTLEVADLLGLSESAVKTRLHRARLALRELLEPAFTDAEPPDPADEVEIDAGPSPATGPNTGGRP